MPYVLLSETGDEPLFTIDHGVGTGMANRKNDVILIQYFLKALLHSRKTYGRGVMLVPPSGTPLNVSGVWDTTSAAYLKSWEDLVYAPGRATFDGPAPFPGTVVSTERGGQKINEMNQMSRALFGDEAHNQLKLPNVDLPRSVRAELFYFHGSP